MRNFYNRTKPKNENNIKPIGVSLGANAGTTPMKTVGVEEAPIAPNGAITYTRNTNNNVSIPKPVVPNYTPVQAENTLKNPGEITTNIVNPPNAAPPIEEAPQGPNISGPPKGEFTTDAMNLYAKNVLRGLKEEDPRTISNRNAARANQGAREYNARMLARESAAAQGFQPGTAQASRLMKETLSPAYQAGVQENADIGNQQRQYFQNAMDRALGVENIANQRNDIEYNRRIDEERYADTKDFRDRGYADQRGDVGFEQDYRTKAYNDNREDITWTRENTARVQDESSAQMYLNNIRDPKTKDFMTSAYASGGLEGLRTAMADIDNAPKSQDPAGDERDFYEGMVRNMGGEFVDTQGNLTQKGKDQVSEYLKQSIELGFEPTNAGTDDMQKTKRSNDRIKSFLDNGDGASINSFDVGRMDEEEIEEAKTKGFIINKSSIENAWEGVIPYTSGDEAMDKFLKKNPKLKEGVLINKKGQYYKITSIELGDEVNLGKGRTINSIKVMAEPFDGGEPIEIYKSGGFNSGGYAFKTF